MQQITTVNVDRIAEMFIKQHLIRLFDPTMFPERNILFLLNSDRN